MGRALMLQGTGSDVGKSLLTAGLCRIARRQGLSVAPFKPQNMSNNAAACPGGGEIGRAQALQARAAGLEPTTDMNPVLLKPESDRRAQLVLHGKAIGHSEAARFMEQRERLLAAVLDSFIRLNAAYDLVLVEGAGSPAEVNLRARDIANMGFARATGVPVCLVGDIDRGGVIAAVVGTQAVLDLADNELICGFLINRFRGDVGLFSDGLRFIEQRTGWPSFGVVPWIRAAARLPAEDAVILERPATRQAGTIRIVAPMLSRIANFDDADPLRQEPQVDFSFIPPGQPLPRDADVVVLLGTKSTVADLAMLREQGWDHDILAHARTGGHVVGLCGGLQMLGCEIADPDGVEGQPGSYQGLGLLNLNTVMQPDKTVRPVSGFCPALKAAVSGYEIHSGRSTGPALDRPLLTLDDGKSEGALSAEGRIIGSYVHGLFGSDGFRRAWLESIRQGSGSGLAYETAIEEALDALADQLDQVVDIEAPFAAARAPQLT